MQLSELTTVQPDLTARAEPSLAVDLSWALHAAFHPAHRGRHQALGALYQEHPSLATRIAEFWSGDATTAGPDCMAELEILTWHAGALAVTDLAELLAALEAAAPSVPTELRLRSESPEDRAAFCRRLAVLRRTPERRREWLQLLADLHAALAHAWPAVRAAAEAAAVAFNRDLAHTAEWSSLVAIECEASIGMLAELGTDDYTRVAVVPSAFFGTGMVLDLPDTLLVGIKGADEGVTARSRTEALARRMKTMADPTRLAILHYVAHRPRSVGEVATAFGLAQPTVSAHVKQLREAGLLGAERRGNRLELVADREALRLLLDDLAAALH